jgi:hypothetical protein
MHEHWRPGDDCGLCNCPAYKTGWPMARTRRDLQRWARKGNTTARGYGAAHQAERERRLARYKPGDICAHGGEPLMWPREIARRWLDLPHNATRTGYLPGLSCRFHNRQEGAQRGNRQRAKPGRWVSARQW